MTRRELDDQQRRLSQRRLEFKRRTPEHFCSACRAVLYEEDEGCLECGASRPQGGWRACRDAPMLLLGRVLRQRYLVTRHLGRGGFANVYRVLALNIVRQFALKLIDLHGLSEAQLEQAQQRIRREIDILGRLNTPHIVSVSDLFMLPDGVVGIVMDLVNGHTIHALVEREGPLVPERVRALSKQIVLGLSAAHQAGVIHRDLKPDNVMVEQLELGVEFAHLLDFGVALMQDHRRITQGFVGTPLFASPEQVRAAPLDERSDIYSLGALMFYMLTGRPPFVGRDVTEVLTQHVLQAPPTLREAHPGGEFSEGWEALISTMLAKRAEERPRDMAEVSRALDALQSAPTLEPSPARALRLEPQQTRVLVVDDDASHRLLIGEILLANQLQPIYASSGAEAIALFGEVLPDLVILDIMMPGMPGTEVCAAIRQISNAPILFLSSRDSERDMVDGLRLGADDYMTKPVSPALLSARIWAILRRGRR